MKKKNKHSIVSNLFYMIRQIAKNDSMIFVISFFTIPVRVIDQLLNVYLTATIVSVITLGHEEKMVYTILLFSAVKCVVSILLQYFDAQLATRNYRSKMQFVSGYAAQYMQADFTDIESIKGKDMASRARNTMFGFDYRAKPMVESISTQLFALASNLCGLFVYGGIISLLNPLILVALILTAGITYLFQKFLVKYDQKDKISYIPIERKIWYLIQEAKNLESAKDVKLYNLSKWIQNIFNKEIKKRVDLYKKRGRLQYLFDVLITVLNLLFSGFIYYYLIQKYLSGTIDLAQFILYFGLITGFNSWLISVIGGIEEVNRTSYSIEDLRLFHSMSSASKAFYKPIPDDLTSSIAFENVTFQYPGSEQPVIHQMSFHINAGEKIAIVGNNGAGKTTLIKLLCGLYQPTKGRILIGGHDIKYFDPNALFEQFSVVFQDIYLIPTSIERNIALVKRPDQLRLDEVLKLSGLKKKIDQLPSNEKTTLLKSVLSDATELSGGETQKLALSRALYKQGKIIILDEPTAALDPIAESEMYQNYRNLTDGKTAIFISHRLSSTRFCDRIFFLENGVVAECGSHEELMRTHGNYARMFEVQSHYYRETVEG